MLPIIRAQVTFLSREDDGGSTMPCLSSGQYRPHLVIQPPDVGAAKVIDAYGTIDDYSGVRFLSAARELIPDHVLDCSMELMYHPRVDYAAVREGATFTLREGGKVIGFGVVTGRYG